MSKIVHPTFINKYDTVLNALNRQKQIGIRHSNDQVTYHRLLLASRFFVSDSTNWKMDSKVHLLYCNIRRKRHSCASFLHFTTCFKYGIYMERYINVGVGNEIFIFTGTRDLFSLLTSLFCAS
jgi:hypothetical protein